MLEGANTQHNPSKESLYDQVNIAQSVMIVGPFSPPRFEPGGGRRCGGIPPQQFTKKI